jgi:hypothetical protein
MKKRFLKFTLIAIGVVLALDVFGLAARRPPISMLVVPARYSFVQIGNDILSHRPAVLVSYRGSAESGAQELFVWDGYKWIPIRLSDFAAINFVRQVPDKLVFVGAADEVAELVAAATWCEDVELVAELETAALLNRFGEIFDFKAAEWNWFAQRYGCELQVTNTEELRGSWYDQSGAEFQARERAEREARLLDLPPDAFPEEIDAAEIPPAVITEEGDEEVAIELEVEELIEADEPEAIVEDETAAEPDSPEAAEELDAAPEEAQAEVELELEIDPELVEPEAGE